jgi:peptidoglycan hydrolase-like protein with peptidoglycan-binding domain
MISGSENLLVVVDQFEEIFRFARVAGDTGYENEAAAFVKLFLEASRQRELPIYVVLTMRSDYLGDCSQFWGLPEAINESQYLIPRLTRDQLREAMTGPISVARGDITPRLVARLLNDVGDNQDQLPVLQHLLMRVWDECKEKQLEVEVEVGGKPVKKPHKTVHSGDALDLCCYEAVGGMTHALSRHADEAFNELPNDRSRKVAEKLFKALTEKGSDNREIRRPVTLGEICAVVDASASEVISVVETFRRPGRSFLMVPAGELNADSLIDISHESLIRAWERLKKWVEEETRSARIYRRLAETAVLHKEAGAGLWRDPDLQIALTWREESKPNEVWARRYHGEFDLAMAFLDQSVAERNRETLEKEKDIQRRKTMKRTRWIALVFGSLFVVSVVALVFANQQRVRANSLLAQVSQSAQRALAAESRAQSALAIAEEQKTLAEKQKTLAVQSAAEAREQRNLAEEAKNKAEERKDLAELQARRIAELERRARQDATEAQEINTLIREVEDQLKQGNAEGVITKVKKQLEYYRKKEDPRGEYESQSILGPVYLKQGQHVEARAAAETALTIQQNQQIDDRDGEHENLVVLREAFLRVADIKEGKARSDELRNAFNAGSRVLRVQEGAIGATNRNLIPDLASLAAITDRGGQHETSEGFRQRIIEIQRKSLQAERAKLVTYLNDLAMFNRVQGDYEHAVTQLKDVLKIQEGDLDADDPQIIATLNGLVELYRLQKNDVEAEKLVKRIQSLQGDDAVLRKGTSGPEVKKLQQQLQAIGYFKGTPDEYFGPETEAAVMEFQTRQGLLADGVAGPRTLSLLENAKSSDVGPKQIQTELQKLGFYTGSLDGSFGIRTKAALMEFQRTKGLVADGAANEETLVALGLKTAATAASVTGRVTPEIIAGMFPNMNLNNIKANLPFILRALEDAGLSDKDMVLMALATIGVDTGDFAPLTERQSRFNTSADGPPFDLYDKRPENEGPGDGERFRGRGYLQLFGRANYKRFGGLIGLGDQLVEYPDLAVQPDIAAKIFAAYLKERENQYRAALKEGNFRRLRMLSTGSAFGLDVFTKAFQTGASLIK